MELPALAVLLKQARTAKGLSQEKAASLLRPRVSRQAWYYWESGKDPEPERFSEIERVLDLAPGTIKAAIAPPLTGGSLEYWRGRAEQIAIHMRTVLKEQETFVEAMAAASRGEPVVVSSKKSATPPPRHDQGKRIPIEELREHVEQLYRYLGSLQESPPTAVNE